MLITLNLCAGWRTSPWRRLYNAGAARYPIVLILAGALLASRVVNRSLPRLRARIVR